MKISNFDNLPNLSKEEALQILATPVDQLYLDSDYYKAAFHLAKYPGLDTEKALISLVETDATQQCIVIAKKKAIEGLARLGCVKAIPSIGECLKSNDPYVVEIAAWALAKLGCNKSSLFRDLSSLLVDPKQNRRVLLQSLASLGATSELFRIRKFLEELAVLPIDRGAAIAAIYKLSSEKIYLDELRDNLHLLNQNDRQCAVQDIIDAGATELLPAVMKTPVAPYFRMKAINKLCLTDHNDFKANRLCKIIDLAVNDFPDNLNLLHSYDGEPDVEYLIEGLFSTDFSRCYLALKHLIKRETTEIWPLLCPRWGKIKKDYGALYFLMILFRIIPFWTPSQLEKIKSLSFSLLEDTWPQYMKFRPAAILTLMKIDPLACRDFIPEWLCESETPFWISRYATLMSLETEIRKQIRGEDIRLITQSKQDSHKFIRLKASQIIAKL